MQRMIKHLFTAALLCGVFALSAQSPVPVSLKGRISENVVRTRSSCANFAGTFQFGLFNGQSNTVGGKLIYLCANDSLDIKHNGDLNLSGDPDPFTPPGVRYAFYDCPPGITGPSLSDILKDRCLNRTSPIIVNNQPVEQTKLWVTGGGTPGGNLTLFNRGQLQSSFSRGKPIAFWFAPITVDDFAPGSATSAYEADPVSKEAGPCVHVNTAAAFQVVYLNAVEGKPLGVSSVNSCQGSFIAKGGFPEYDTSGIYSIRIQKVGDPDVKGYLLSSSKPHHLDTVRFFAPEPGDYEVLIEDGISCEALFTMSMSGCSPVEFSLPFVNRLPGDSVCLPLTIKNFKGVGALEMDFTWDEKVIRFTEIKSFNDSVGGLGLGNMNIVPQGGQINLSWLDPRFGGVTLPDGDTLFSLCFVVVGNLGDKSPVRIVPSLMPPETVGTPDPKPIGFILRSGQVNVSSATLFFDVVADSVSCDGFEDGRLIITLANGRPPYDITYQKISPAPLLSGSGVIAASGNTLQVPQLPAGLYRVSVRDQGTPRNVAIDTVEIVEPPDLAVRLIETDPACFSSTDGAVRAEVLVNSVLEPNPLSSYTFRWNLPGETGDGIDSLRGGAYAVTVTNPSGCTSTASTNLSSPAAISLTPTITTASCSGIADGGIGIAVKGGSPDSAGRYTFIWNGEAPVKAASFSKSKLLPGTYCLVVSDEKGCQTQQCVTIGAKKTLVITASVSDASCNSRCDGAVSVLGSTLPATSSATPYTFSWDRRGSGAPVNTPTGSAINGLCAGRYVVTMRDSDPAGCSLLDTIEVKEPDPLQVSLSDLVNETCVVGKDGSAAVSVKGGTRPYSFEWNNGQRDSTARNLAAGTYTLKVKDIRSCETNFEVKILAPTPPQVVGLSNDTLACASDTNGELFVNARAGGAAILSYRWSNGASGPRASGLLPGEYTVAILAADGCQTLDTARVVAPDTLRIKDIVVSAPRCPGEANGSALVSGEGGTKPYRYLWARGSGVDTTFFPLRPGLSKGSYSMTLTDANLCPGVVRSVTVSDPPRIEVAYSDIQAVSCFEKVCDGAATISGRYSNGTSGRFTFTWANGEVFSKVQSARAKALCGGRNAVVVVDSNACSIVDTLLVPSPEAIRITFDTVPVSCYAGKDGKVTAKAQGGVPGYTFQWVEAGLASNELSGIGVGRYTVQVRDKNACVKEAVFAMRQPAQLRLTVDPAGTNNARCFGGNDGRIRVVINQQDSINPLSVTSYTWSGDIASASSNQAVKLSAGSYSVTVTDIKGCQAVLNYDILQPDPIVAVIPKPKDPRCYGESTVLKIDTIYGGNGGNLLDYTYSVNNTGLSFSPNQAATVFAGDLLVTVEDPLGCTLTDTITVTQPAELRVVFDPVELVVELGDTLTALQPIITGTTPIQTYAWSPAANLSAANIKSPFILNLLEDQTFRLNVTDVNGCKASGSIFVELDKNRNVFIPNVFSPNGDGWNDELRVFACKGVTKINYAVVFDRWGGQVFEARNITVDCLSGAPLWDGKVGGRIAPSGVYVYLVEVEFLDGVVLLYRGETGIIR